MRGRARWLLFTVAALPLLLGAKGCNDCKRSKDVVEAACKVGKAACEAALAVYAANCPTPEEPPPTPKPDEPTKPTPPPVVEPPKPEEPPPTPPPTPAPGCAYPAREAQLEALVGGTSSRLAEVLAGERALGDLRSPGRNPTALARANNRKLAAHLRAGGLCAFAGQEAIFVQSADPNAWEEHHAAAETDGGWTQRPYVGNHRNVGATVADAPDAPEIEEAAAAACPVAPCPIREWTRETLPDGWGDDEIGRAAWSWKAKAHTMGNCDSTPAVKRQLGFCQSIGFNNPNEPPRAECPVRPDGHPDREAVERWLLGGGPVIDSRNGQDCRPNNTDNAFAFLCGTGNCRICDTGKKTCSEWW